MVNVEQIEEPIASIVASFLRDKPRDEDLFILIDLLKSLQSDVLHEIEKRLDWRKDSARSV